MEQFAASPVTLRFKSPIPTVVLQPGMLLVHVEDHLVAIGAIIRTPNTILALLTVLRPLWVACGLAYHLTDDQIDARECVHRAMNVELESATEPMNYVQEEGQAFSTYEARRIAIATAGRMLGSHLAKPDKRKLAAWWPTWYLGDRPPSEMALLNGMLGSVGNRQIGSEFYRLLSAATHAQQHAMYTLLHTSLATPAGPGVYHAPSASAGERC